MIRHKCSGCGSSLKIKDELRGKPGKCPKCKAAFIVGESAADDLSDDAVLPSDDSPAMSSSSSASASSADDEDDMFGKDFFKLQAPVERPKFTMPTYDDEHVIPEEDESKPAKNSAKGSTKAPEKAAPAVSSVDSAAAIASQLLAKTGKKNKTPEMEAVEAKAQEEAEKVDYTELKYALTHKVLPFGGGAILLVVLLYWMFTSMLADKSKLPQLGLVSGIVKVQGAVAGNCEVRFEPQPELAHEIVNASFSTGRSDASGAYQLQYNPENPGAAVGKHRVTVIHNGAIYNKDVEVKAGKNDIPLDF